MLTLSDADVDALTEAEVEALVDALVDAKSTHSLMRTSKHSSMH